MVDGINSTSRMWDRTKCERMRNGQKSLVAATFEKAKTYVFAEMMIHNPKVAGSSTKRFSAVNGTLFQ